MLLRRRCKELFGEILFLLGQGGNLRPLPKQAEGQDIGVNLLGQPIRQPLKDPFNPFLVLHQTVHIRAGGQIAGVIPSEQRKAAPERNIVHHVGAAPFPEPLVDAAVPARSKRLVKAAAVGLSVCVDADQHQNIGPEPLRQRLRRHHLQPHALRPPLFRRTVGKTQGLNVRPAQGQQQRNSAASRPIQHNSAIAPQSRLQFVHGLLQPGTLPMKAGKNFSNSCAHIVPFQRFHMSSAALSGDRPK